MNLAVSKYLQHTAATTLCCTVERFTFTGKGPRKGWRIPLNEIKYNEQRDEETGYGYFGARYMDHELMTMWLSVDPMADKYPGISPYAYCAWNPVKLVDPDGREWDPSALTQEQQGRLIQSIRYLCDNSPLFEELYNTLTESSEVYKLQIGPTQDGASAQYNQSDKSLTFLDEDVLGKTSAFVEEMIHAYQLSENSCLYDASVEFNYEFEAKVIKNLIQWESCGVSPIPGMESMQTVIQNDYEFGVRLNFTAVTSESFANEYRRNANNYATYNKMNNIGNGNYHTSTNQSPASLNLLLQIVRP